MIFVFYYYTCVYFADTNLLVVMRSNSFATNNLSYCNMRFEGGLR